MTPERILLGLNSVLIAIVGYLVLRAISRMDASLDELKKTDRAQELMILELRLRVGALEQGLQAQQIWRDEISRFFQALGFKRSEGLPPTGSILPPVGGTP